MRLKYTTKAKQQLKRLPESAQVSILTAIEAIKDDPFNTGELLRGSRTLYRLRENSYRIIYSIPKSGSLLKIIFIEERSSHTYHRVNSTR